jgi:hypothetical protein
MIGFCKTKPLQVELIKKQFEILNYEQNSDLGENKYTKFVHYSKNEFFDFKKIYKSRGIQGLQKYKFWTCRTKDIN